MQAYSSILRLLEGSTHSECPAMLGCPFLALTDWEIKIKRDQGRERTHLSPLPLSLFFSLSSGHFSSFLKMLLTGPGTVAYALNPSTCEAEVGGSR